MAAAHQQATPTRPSRPRLDSLRSTTTAASSLAGGGGPRPPSPTFSTTTTNSYLPPDGPHLLITRADLRQALASYEDLLSAGKAYRQSLLAKSHATAQLASAMDACARVKGADRAGPGLQACAGFHYVVSGSEQVLADTFYKNFEIPLLDTLDAYRRETSDRQLAHERALVAQTRALRQTEQDNLRQARSKRKTGAGAGSTVMSGRDLGSFRRTLELLQQQVDGLDRLKGAYYEEVLEHEEEVWEEILSKLGMVVKTQLEVYDRIMTKADDPVLEPLLAANPDPFDAYSQPGAHQEASSGPLFSILPPIGLPPPPLASSSSSLGSTPATTSAAVLSFSSSSTSTSFSTLSTSASTARPHDLPLNGSGRNRDVSDTNDGDDDGFLSPRQRSFASSSAIEELAHQQTFPASSFSSTSSSSSSSAFFSSSTPPPAPQEDTPHGEEDEFATTPRKFAFFGGGKKARPLSAIPEPDATAGALAPEVTEGEKEGVDDATVSARRPDGVVRRGIPVFGDVEGDAAADGEEEGQGEIRVGEGKEEEDVEGKKEKEKKEDEGEVSNGGEVVNGEEREDGQKATAA